MNKPVAIVTGASGSLGSAASQCLADDGWRVVQTDLSTPALLAPGAHFRFMDVTSKGSIGKGFSFAASLGDIRAVVIAHGILLSIDPDNIDEHRFDELLKINVKGVVLACSMAAAAMGSGGSIVVLGSFAASRGRGEMALGYQATKAAVEAVTRSYAIKLASRDIRVNCVVPGFVTQPMGGEGGTLRALQGGNTQLSAQVPLGRLVTPAEVANAISFLCSDKSSAITGVILPVDGGQLAY